MTVPVRFRIIGAGRAGGSLGLALARAGWERHPDLGRGDDPTDAADDVDLLVIAAPDASVREIATAVRPDPRTVIAHLAGSLGLDVLGDHARPAAIHPLVSLPDPETGARRLASGAWFAVAGDPLVQRAVTDLGGRFLNIADGDRTVYHAAAAVASNHLVALLGQVERLAARIGVPLDAYLDLVRASVDNVAELGPAAALTGPVARGDWDTVARHLHGLPADERATYRALAAEAARLAGRTLPPDGSPAVERLAPPRPGRGHDDHDAGGGPAAP